MNIVAALRTPRAGAVEMPPRGKRGKLPERVSHPFHRAWKSGTRQPDSHISTAPAADLLIRKETRKDEKKTEFQLTDSITSSTIRTPASLRSENDQLHLGTGDRNQSKSPITFIGISTSIIASIQETPHPLRTSAPSHRGEGWKIICSLRGERVAAMRRRVRGHIASP
jgi:hypothetical protein